MRVLVLGGTRFVGRAIVDQAVSRGHDVTTFTRGRHGEPRPGAEALHGDRTRHQDLLALAGRDWDAVIDTSVIAPAHVAASAGLLAGHAGHYTYVSSLSAYSGRPREPVAEGSPTPIALGSHSVSDREELLQELRKHAVVHGDFVLSSGQRASWYVDLRRVLLSGRIAPLAGRVMLDATADLSYEAIGGLTLGADPVAAAMMHASAQRGQPLDAFVVRKAGKEHGLQRRIEGPDVAGRRVLAVEDTSTTGNSVLTAVAALREAGAEVVGVAVVVERGARPQVHKAGLPYRAAYELSDLGLG